MTVSYTPTTSHLAEFSPLRLFWLIRNRVLQDLIPLGIGAAVVFGLNLLGLFFSPHVAFFNLAFFNFSPGSLWEFVVIVASPVFASTAFKDMQSGKSGTEWLLLPATALEKYLAALLELIVLIPVVIIALSSGLSALLAGLQGIAGGVGGSIWTPLTWNSPGTWGWFAVSNLLILTGSAVFRKQALLKTLGVIIGFGLVLVSIMTVIVPVVAWLFLRNGNHIESLNFETFSSNGSSFYHFGNGRNTPLWVTDTLAMIWEILYFGITPVAALAFGYFRIREKEAKDAVQ